METKEVTGRAKGGIAVAAKMTPEQRKDRASKGAVARWGLKATHKGNFKEELGIDVECYVLNDEHKTAVISQTGMGKALGLSERGNAFPRFISSQAMQSSLGAELQAKLQNPLKFQWASGGALPSVTVHGSDATLLIDVCRAILAVDAAGKLKASQKTVAANAAVLLGASAKSGIKGLVYALSGYDATREDVVAAFKFFVREEAREYEKEFPDQLYAEWYRLYSLPIPARNKPWKFKHLTVDQVYRPLAKSNGKILELTQAQRDGSEDRHKKLHQFLSEIGVKALRTQLGQLLGIARISKSQDEYENHFQTLFGDQPRLL